MPKFQARYFATQDEAIPSRVDPVEAADHQAALLKAKAKMQLGEARVELADLDDEFRRGQPEHHGLVDNVYTQVGETVAMLTDRYSEVKDTATTYVDEVKAFVKKKPYVAIGIGAAVAYLIGLHVGAGDRRVIYLKDHRG